MAKDRDTITTIHGERVTVELEHWLTLLERIRGAIGNNALEDEDLATLERSRRGGGCGDACTGHGGCDFAAGEPPERVFVCQDGHVILEDEV